MKFAGKRMELEKNHSEWGNPDSERQIWYLFAYLRMLAVKSMITKLQSVVPQSLGIE